MNSNAPEELKLAFYNGTLSLNDLKNNPEWIEWLEGEEDYIRENCTIGMQFMKWCYSPGASDFLSKIDEYLSVLFNDEIRNSILNDEYVREGIITEKFKQRNSDLFFDDLPYHLHSYFEGRCLTMSIVFRFNEADKKALKGKNMARAFGIKYQDFFRVFGGQIESFELYEKYKGIIKAVMQNVPSIYPLNNDKEREEKLQEVFLNNIDIYRGPYSDEVPDEFKKKHSEYFLDNDAPKELKSIFYNQNWSIMVHLGEEQSLDFSVLRKYPEFVPFLKGKNISHCMIKGNCIIGGYDNYFEFCGSQDIALELGVKYGDIVKSLDYSESDTSVKDKEKVIMEKIYHAISNHIYKYDDSMPESFKNQYPELFLDDEAPDELKRKFYTKGKKTYELTFNFLRENPEYCKFLKNKKLNLAMDIEYNYIFVMCGEDTEKFLKVGLEYGDILRNEQLKNGHAYLTYTSQSYKEKEDKVKSGEDDDIIGLFEEIIGESIKNGKLVGYDDSLPLSVQYKYPEFFLLPEEIERLKSSIDEYDPEKEVDALKKAFYERYIGFSDLEKYSVFKDIIKHKNIDRCMRFFDGGIFLKEFANVLDGNYDKAYNLAVKKFSRQLDDILYANHGGEDKIPRLIQFYKLAGFIPHQVVFDKLPDAKIQGFVLNKKLWAKLMEMSEYNSDSDYIGALFEAAMVMGVFETKEFLRNGRTMLQGAGQEGFEKLQGFLNHIPEFFSYSDYRSEYLIPVKRGYKKIEEDYADAERYRKIIIVCSNEHVIDELRDGTLTDYDMRKHILRGYYSPAEFEYCFRKDENGFYHCIIDENSTIKVKKLLKSVGIKKDKWLSKEEFELIKKCNRNFISNAFIEENGNYRFNISQQEEYFVIGAENDITEPKSKENKRLFDYVRFLMQENGMEELAVRLAANNDRSNIDLVLSREQAEKLFDIADKICEKVKNNYVECNFYKLAPESKGAYKYIDEHRLHQLFDGLKMEYSKEFRDFILENKESLVENFAATISLDMYQQKFLELLKDPDYANVKLTPEILIKAMIPGDNYYKNKKAGFEKGEELAQKFAFSQEYFEVAQEIWEIARKREASSIPRVEGKEENYTYEVLRLDDATGIFMGELTNCCQRLSGAGESAMIHSMTEKNGRVFVVRDERDKVIAQAWLWRNGNVICFDNVEVAGRAHSIENQKAIYKILKKVSKELCDKDKEVMCKLVQEGVITKEDAEKLQAKKVTVGKGHNDIEAIAHSAKASLEETDPKRPIEQDKVYQGITSKKLYLLDSIRQLILYEADDYRLQISIPTMAIHRDGNLELECKDISSREIKTIKAIKQEIEPEEKCDFKTRDDLLKAYDVDESELRLVLGSDWFMLYSENETNIKVHEILKSPSSGILDKSRIEQEAAIKMLIEKAVGNKHISIDAKNERVYEASKLMLNNMKEAYDMNIDDDKEKYCIKISGIQER